MGCTTRYRSFETRFTPCTASQVAPQGVETCTRVHMLYFRQGRGVFSAKSDTPPAQRAHGSVPKGSNCRDRPQTGQSFHNVHYRKFEGVHSSV